MTRATSPVRERTMPLLAAAPSSSVRIHAASIAAVSLFGGSWSSASYGQLGAEVQRGVYMAGRRDRGLRLIGGCCAARPGGGRLLIRYGRATAGGCGRIVRVGVCRAMCEPCVVGCTVGLPVAHRRPVRYGRMWVTHEFYVASASVLDMPRVRVSLRLCQVWRVGRRAVYGPVRDSFHLSGGDLPLLLRSEYCEGKYERSNRWCCTTAVLGLALAVPVLVVATRIPGARFHRPVRLDMDPCTPGTPGRREPAHVRAAPRA
jgi:hypothetical protein